jgi:hypothetical protein
MLKQYALLMLCIAFCGCKDEENKLTKIEESFGKITSVFFITDSIGFGRSRVDGYIYHVSEMLPGINIGEPLKNSRGTPQIIENLNWYREEYPVDTHEYVMINAGLWDSNGVNTPQTSLDEYEFNVEYIIDWFTANGYKVVWINTTNVTGQIISYNQMIDGYNQIASRICEERNIPIYDMNFLQHVSPYELKWDDTHFQQNSVVLQADHLSEWILNFEY